MDSLLLGRGREIRREPAPSWRGAIEGLPGKMAARLAFMTPHHHLVRDFVVRELPREGRPIGALRLSQTLGIPLPEVTAILGDLEKNLFFLVRNSAGEVSWAFPVTSDQTPHRLRLSTREKIFGA